MSTRRRPTRTDIGPQAKLATINPSEKNLRRVTFDASEDMSVRFSPSARVGDGWSRCDNRASRVGVEVWVPFFPLIPVVEIEVTNPIQEQLVLAKERGTSINIPV